MGIYLTRMGKELITLYAKLWERTYSHKWNLSLHHGYYLYSMLKWPFWLWEMPQNTWRFLFCNTINAMDGKSLEYMMVIAEIQLMCEMGKALNTWWLLWQNCKSFEWEISNIHDRYCYYTINFMNGKYLNYIMVIVKITINVTKWLLW